MKKSKNKVFYHAVNVVSIFLIVECFLCSMMLVEKHVKDNCLERIEETAVQMSTMFVHAMDERQEKLTVFADILAANSENPDELLQTYMDNFCKTQEYAAVCIHRADGTTAFYGHHPHEDVEFASFEEEVAKLPYVSGVFSYGREPENNYVYQAVPIVRGEKTVAVLYGYLTLDIFPDLIASSAFDGACHLHVVDGDTGDLLMGDVGQEVGNVLTEQMKTWQMDSGYSVEKVWDDIRLGESGYFVFRLKEAETWYYTYYMPVGINNWSMHLSIDEPTVFAAYTSISRTMMVLMVLVILLIVMLVTSLVMQNTRVSKRDKQRLRKIDFINSVQHSLLNAYTNSDSVYQALKTLADEMQAETVILISFQEKIVSTAQCWPSKDKHHAANLLGTNIQEEFPTMYDILSSGENVVYNEEDPVQILSESTASFFRSVDIARLQVIPIRDTADGLKGIIAIVNAPAGKSAELVESVVYDFFMAITNLENHSIIKKMGTIDYLTGLKNRNSFETETPGYATLSAQTLWCAFVDVNGLHELNNQKGHKAGDLMLCTVADAIRRIFGADHAYRLGGDEFVVFKKDSSHEKFMSCKYRMYDDLGRKGYSVSVGFASVEKNRNGVFDVEKVLADAEKIMYRDKWEYYEKNNIPRERDYFPESRFQLPEQQ